MKHASFKTLATALCALLAIAACYDADAAVRKTPYVIFRGDNTEMQVLWQLTLTDSCTIEWGEDTNYSLGNAKTAEYGGDHQHAHLITGLTPGTVCYYRVTAEGQQFTGSFRAAPPDYATGVKFFAYGDTRTYPADHDDVAAGLVSTYTSDPEFQSMALFAGDFVTNGNYEDDWDTEFFDPAYDNIQSVLRNLAFQACMGNHEGLGLLFQKYFPYPFVASRYWSFDYGPVHFVIVDQYTDYSTGSAQHTWIDADLAATYKPWKIVCLHEPGWSAGGHPNNTTVQDHIQPLCVEHGVQMMFAGHNHYYARAEVNGVVHITTGGGGAPLRDPLPGYPYIITKAKEYHYCKIAIDGDLLIFRAITPGGTVIDSISIDLAAGVDPELDGDAHTGPWLESPSPSPFRTNTEIAFSIPARSHVDIAIYGVGGRTVRTLLSQTVEPGDHIVQWDGKDDTCAEVPTGIYFCRLRAGDQVLVRKVLALR